MDELKEKVAPSGGGYPQLNFNTTLDVATLVLLLGATGWLFALKGNVDAHELRLVTVEVSIKELRTQFDTTRFAQAQSATQLEGRLVGIESLLREVINRLERDRRGNPPLP